MLVRENRMQMFFKAAIFSAAGVAVLAGCSTHLDKTAPARTAWEMGEADAAQAALKPFVWKYENTDDEVIWRLEYGAAAHASGDVKKSAESFEAAEKKMSFLENNTDAVIADEADAILANKSQLPYRGRNYDRIMMSAYQALNYMELGDFRRAETSLKRMEDYQQNAKSTNLKNIERAQKALSAAQKKSQSASYDVSKTLSDAGVENALKSVYGDDFSAKERGRRPSGDYVNPFAYWLSGIYFSTRPEDSSGKEKAADFFRLADKSAGGKNAGLKADRKLADALADGDIASMPPRTYIIFEKGAAPLRVQSKVDLPIYIANGNAPHVTMNFPHLKRSPLFKDDVSVIADGKEVKLERIADMDAIIEHEFDEELPGVITKTVVSAAVKADLQVSSKQAEDDGLAGFAVNVAGSIYQSVVNDADLRTWTSLPKEILTASFDTPKNGSVRVGEVALALNPDSTNVILIRKTAAGAKTTVRSFELPTQKNAAK